MDLMSSPLMRTDPHEVNLGKRLAFVPLVWIFKVWLATLRFRLSPGCDEALLHQKGLLIVTWHNRVFSTIGLQKRLRPGRALRALVSASRDGAWLTSVFSRFGVKTIRGSSSRRGAAALREILLELRAGNDIAITLDGPRGPAYVAKTGIGLLARKSRAPIVFMIPVYRNAWRLRSWDRFFIPKPFSTVEIHLEVETSTVSAYGDLSSDEAGKAIGNRLRRLSAGTDPGFGL